MTARHDDGPEGPESRFVEIIDADDKIRWRLDAGFLTSRWQCIWGAGCQGIHETRQPELHDGCCSVGVVLTDEEEAMNIAAIAAALSADEMQFHDAGRADGFVQASGGRWTTRVVDGACIFLNRPGFSAGPGCSLHRAALEAGDEPIRWKPQTCSRIPLRVDELELRSNADDALTDITVRAWRRDDWGPGGATMAWWCTEAPEAFCADEPVTVTLEQELRDIVGDRTYDELRARLRYRSEAPG
ncbi:MAG: hypothetical protein AB7Q27_25275, partial [Acidimicrobiia bacterium]